MTKPQLLIVSSIVASAGAVLAVAETIKAIPGIPGWLSNAWPVVLVLATLIHRIGAAIIDSQEKKP